MRELKFRGWDTRFKRMKVTGMGINGGILTSDNLEIMQYTDFKDKNGKEIYEGDIVHISLPGFGIEKNLLVEWKDGKYTEPMFEDYHREVIGNIYENPELLK